MDKNKSEINNENTLKLDKLSVSESAIRENKIELTFEDKSKEVKHVALKTEI